MLSSSPQPYPHVLSVGCLKHVWSELLSNMRVGCHVYWQRCVSCTVFVPGSSIPFSFFWQHSNMMVHHAPTFKVFFDLCPVVDWEGAHDSPVAPRSPCGAGALNKGRIWFILVREWNGLSCSLLRLWNAPWATCKGRNTRDVKATVPIVFPGLAAWPAEELRLCSEAKGTMLWI